MRLCRAAGEALFAAMLMVVPVPAQSDSAAGDSGVIEAAPRRSSSSLRTVNAAALGRRPADTGLARPAPASAAPAVPAAAVPPGTGGRPLAALHAQYLSGSRGHLLRQVYDDVPGRMVGELLRAPAFPDAPTSSDYVAGACGASRSAVYGQVLRGYLYPPVSGAYTFWLSTDASAELWLSSSDDPEQRRLAAQVLNPTQPDQWEAFAEQRSDPLQLDQDKRYYVEVLHKASGGSDHVEVAWEGPGISRQRIAPECMSPFALGNGSVMRVYWAGAAAAAVGQARQAARFAPRPAGRDRLDRLELTQNAGVAGSLVSGWLHAPVSGDYVLWLEAAGEAELRLSADDNPANLAVVAAHTLRAADAPSVGVCLVGGRRYSIELAQADGQACRVLWRVPGRERAVVDGRYLSAPADR